MRKTIFSFQSKRIRWRRYSNRANASFLSLHRQVSVGVLTVAMLATADLKANASSPVSELVPAVNQRKDAPPEDDPLAAVNLTQVEVTAVGLTPTDAGVPRLITVLDRAGIEAAAVHSINDLLKYVAGIDVRQRGEMGVQTDLSVHGGTFDQLTVLLNGVNITSPQTGHLTADFPVSVEEIERVEVLEGTAVRAYGTASFSGCINLVTRQDPENIRVSLGGGDYGLGLANASVHSRWGTTGHHLSGGYSRSDGATANSDFWQSNGFYLGKWDASNIQLQWQAGFSQKAYGANTFYSAAYPNQWEENRRWTGAVQLSTKGVVEVKSSLYWNRFYDHFQLIRANTQTGENYHRTDVAGFNATAFYRMGASTFSLNGEAKNEWIYSSNLGKPATHSVDIPGTDKTYARQDSRAHYSLTAGYELQLDDWVLSTGLQLHKDSRTDTRWGFYPGVDLTYRPSTEWRFYASCNQSFRTPTFTELYYKSPTNEGNAGLKAEQITSTSLGANYRISGVDARAHLFYNRCTDLIDWVKYSADDVFHSANFRLDNIGAETTVTLLPREWQPKSPLRRVQVGYAYIHQDRKDGQVLYKSNYALEYLRHKWVIQAESRLYHSIYASVAYRWQQRTGAYEVYKGHQSTGVLKPYKAYGLADMRLMWEGRQLTVYAEAGNLFNTRYYDLGNIPQPGRWVKGGIRWQLK